MTLEEAIKHCEEKVEELKEQAGFDTDNERYRMSESEKADCIECANEHKQLADWLIQLKQVQDIVEHWNDKSSSFVSACNAFEDILHIFGKGVGDEDENSN